MSKVNNRGFLLAESLIVSTFVLTVLIFLFVQFRNLMVNHKRSYTYNNVADIYNLGSIADYLKNNDQTYHLKQSLGENSYMILYEDNQCINIQISETSDMCKELAEAINLEKLIYTNSDIDNLKQNIENSELDQDMKDFIKRVDATKVEGKGRLIAKFKNGNFATIAIDNTQIIVTSFSGTVYALNTDPVTLGTSTKNDLVSTITSQPYYESAADVMSASGYTIYNKYTVENDTITEGYSCQKFSMLSDPVCVKGGNSSYYDYNGTTGNWKILDDLFNDSAFTTNDGSCTQSSSETTCSAGGVGSYAGAIGYVSAWSNSARSTCEVHDNGTGRCYGW